MRSTSLIRAGYRSGAMLTIAREVASGTLDMELWRDPELPTDELAVRIRELPGFGPYATEHLLKLLGRYDHLAARQTVLVLDRRINDPGEAADGSLQLPRLTKGTIDASVIHASHRSTSSSEWCPPPGSCRKPLRPNDGTPGRMNWFKRLFTPGHEPTPALLEAPAPVPPWALELLEGVQKAGRAQAKAMARIEALESKLEGGFADLRSRVSPRPPAALSFDEVLDAMDTLDQACRTLEGAGNAPAAQGLRGVVDRLQRFLARMGLTRVAEPPVALDGRLFRAVGVVERPDLADGAPAQVVRAATLAGERVVREGEVLINRRP